MIVLFSALMLTNMVCIEYNVAFDLELHALCLMLCNLYNLYIIAKFLSDLMVPN